MTFTLTLALAVVLLLCAVLVQSRRRRLRSLLPHLLGSYLLAAVLTEPFVYYLSRGMQSRTVIDPGTFTADLTNLVVPTSFGLVAGDVASALSTSFPNVTAGQEAYLGLPALAILALFFWTRRRAPTGRFLLGCFAIALLAPLGTHAEVLGRRIMALPWTLINSWPLLDDLQPVRFSLFLSFVTAVVAALWMAGRRTDGLRAVLPVFAVLAIAADPIASDWASSTNFPQFFTESAYRNCLDPGETILPLPIGQGSAMLWQAEDDFRFNMTGGYVGPLRSGVVHETCRHGLHHDRVAPRARAGRDRACLHRREARDGGRGRRGRGAILLRRSQRARDPTARRRRLALPARGRAAVLSRRLIGHCAVASEPVPRRRSIADPIALLGYVAISFAYFGWRLLPHPGRSILGLGHDPEISIWSFAWWPHAIGSWTNPFVSHAIYAPSGVNLAWTPSAPGLALVFSPITILFGPVASFNVAALLMPALSAWTAYLLCRYLTRSIWASVVGGYLYGFSTAMLRQQLLGHLNLTGVFLIPLVALFVVRFVRSELSARGLAWRLGVLLACQLWISTEVAFTLTVVLALGLLLAGWLVRDVAAAFAPPSAPSSPVTPSGHSLRRRSSSMR